MRPRSYSLSLTRPPFLMSYSGVLFRRYPEEWQSLLDRGTGKKYRQVTTPPPPPSPSPSRAPPPSTLHPPPHLHLPFTLTFALTFALTPRLQVKIQPVRPPLGTFKAELTEALRLGDEAAASAISQAGV